MHVEKDVRRLLVIRERKKDEGNAIVIGEKTEYYDNQRGERSR